VGVISRFEGGLDSAFDRAAGTVFRGPIEPAQIAKRAEKQMKHEKLVGAGVQYAPTLFTVLVNQVDNHKLFNFYPTMAAELETYLVAKGTQDGLKFDGRPLVRFIVDKDLRSGKFDVIAENVSAPIIKKLRNEEMEYYGLVEKRPRRKRPAPEVDEIDEAPFRNEKSPTRQDAAKLKLAELMETPAVLSQARLSDLSAGQSYAFTTSPLVLGRDSSCDIPIKDANISRRHAEFTQDALGTWKISDLGSTNGIKLNGSTITSALLRDGDQITFGITVLEFRDR